MGTIFREEEREKKTEKETKGISDNHDWIIPNNYWATTKYQKVPGAWHLVSHNVTTHCGGWSVFCKAT